MMEWNAKTPSLWDWDNPLLCGGGGGYKPPSGSCGVGIGVGCGASSGSELGNVCSSKSSVSASTDSSSREAKAPSVLCFEAYRNGVKCTQDAGRAPAAGSAGGLGESPIGLRLGKRTYFEDAAAVTATEGNAKKGLSPLAAAPERAPPPALVKKSRVSHQSVQGVCCQVEGCNVDLSAAKDYHRKHRVCESHTKCPRVIVAGQERRFCQQCSRFHDLSEFDQKKRSCRKRLSDHNARRRKPQADIISFDSAAAFSLSAYDDIQHINFLWNKAPSPMRLSGSSTWENMYDFKLPQARGPWTTKTGGNTGQLVPNRQLSNSFPPNCHEVERLLPLKGTTADVLNQGSEASIGASNLNGAPDLRRALSLLSASSWVSSDPGEPSLIQLSDANTNTTRSSMHAANSTSIHWQDGHSLALQTRGVPFTMQNGGDQLQEFQQHKEPYETSYFDFRQIH